MPDRRRYLPYVGLVLASLAVVYYLYLGVVASLVTAGKLSEITLDDNRLLSLALSLDPTHAEANAAQAIYLRQRALLADNPEPVADLTRSLFYRLEATKGRPFWPYYQLGALDSEYLLQAPEYVLEERINWLIETTPNERGMDRQLLELALLAWPKLSSLHQRWMIDRFQSANHSDRVYIRDAARRYETLVPTLNPDDFSF